MPIVSEELTCSRREEIIAACRRLYETMRYQEISLKDIARETSMSRPSLYNYFETKDEIFLALLQQEYETLTAELEDLAGREGPLSVEALSEGVARALDRRQLLLRLLSKDLFEMEDKSRPERLTEFKRAYGAWIRALERCLQKALPELDDKRREAFLCAFLPFVYGLYPYTAVTPKQCEAMDSAGAYYPRLTSYEMARACILQLLAKENAAPCTPQTNTSEEENT